MKRESERQKLPPIKDEDFLRGDLLARLGREREAEDAFRGEIRSFPENPNGWTGLALLYASQGKSEQSREILRQMTEKSPRPEALFAAARTFEVLGDRASSAAVRRKAASMFPGASDPGAATR